MKARDYINKLKPDMVGNWSCQASLLSYGDVAELMEGYAKSHLKERDEGIKKIHHSIEIYADHQRDEFDRGYVCGLQRALKHLKQNKS